MGDQTAEAFAPTQPLFCISLLSRVGSLAKFTTTKGGKRQKLATKHQLMRVRVRQG